ncbi:MAG: SufE family protein [Planctomycetia bacterium]
MPDARVLWTEANDSGARLIADVAPEAPTVKGFVAILAKAVEGRPPAEAATIPEDLLEKMGLADVLGILRSRGLRAIMSRVKRELAGRAAEKPA